MFGTVVSEQGFKVEFVVLNEDKTPQFYEMQEGESIVETDWAIANSMNKPQWDGVEWVDTDPLPPVEPPVPEVDKISVLEKENAKLWDTVTYLLAVTEQIPPSTELLPAPEPQEV